MTQEKIYIYGKHALMEAISHAPRALRKVYLSKQLKDDHLRSLVDRAGIPISELSGNATPGVDSSAVHQGVIGVVSLKALVIPYEEFIQTLTPTPDTALVLLGEVQDPHNVGAVIRSAAAFGVSAVLIPEHNQAPVTGTVVKVSAGMAFRIPLVSIGNVNHTVRLLKEKGFWVYGLAGEGSKPITAEAFDAPSVFILGNESHGIRLKTRELCDSLVSIPINPRCESLNAAASAAIALYDWSQKHPRALLKKKG